MQPGFLLDRGANVDAADRIRQHARDAGRKVGGRRW